MLSRALASFCPQSPPLSWSNRRTPIDYSELQRTCGDFRPVVGARQYLEICHEKKSA
ncbi:hypothetical protein EMIT0P44_120019 [Pseudomonas sp. IT-P44]